RVSCVTSRRKSATWRQDHPKETTLYLPIEYVNICVPISGSHGVKCMRSKATLLKRHAVIALLLGAALITGCASTPDRAAAEGDPDPLEPANRAFFSINETLDKYLIKPVAETYADVAPEPFRVMVTNFFDNLTYLNVILNSFLQGKFNEGFSDVGRFIINSTIGIGGLVDVATDMGMEIHDEDLGQTLAVWGAGQGPYVYLPVRGPNSARDLPGIATSYLLNPLIYVTGAVLFPVTALGIINTRANLLDETSIRDEAAIDVYSFTREAYIQRREYLIHDGNPPSEGYDDIFDEDTDEDSVLIIE
ncbi:MAG: MlaA family lipoprotein, partial [Gammaproteobacteria bacterium]